jgi:hypothetical protein
MLDVGEIGSNVVLVRRTRRVAVSILVALCGIAIAAGSRLSWVSAHGSRPAAGINDTAVTGLLHWHYEPCNTYFNSFGFVVIVCGALVFIGGVIASRGLAGLFSFITLVAAGLWIALNHSHYKSVSLSYSDFRVGAVLVVAGGVVALISHQFLRGRRTL